MLGDRICTDLLSEKGHFYTVVNQGPGLQGNVVLSRKKLPEKAKILNKIRQNNDFCQNLYIRINETAIDFPWNFPSYAITTLGSSLSGLDMSRVIKTFSNKNNECLKTKVVSGPEIILDS